MKRLMWMLDIGMVVAAVGIAVRPMVSPDSVVLAAPPTITNITPNFGPTGGGPLAGGTNVVITGRSFRPGARAFVGPILSAVEATNVVVVNANTITAPIPPGAALGLTNVIVITLSFGGALDVIDEICRFAPSSGMMEWARSFAPSILRMVSAVTTHGTSVRDASDADFDTAVIRRSHDVPVVVDFWAPWCGPCRQLGPLLERMAAAADGAWELVKLNVDDNPRTATQYRVQGIPAVKGFRDGRMVAEFTGAVPESQVRTFLTRLLPNEADLLARAGAEMEASGYAATAEDRYRDALAKDPNHARATVGLARVLAGRDASEEALALLDRLPGNADALALRVQLALRQAAGDTDTAALEARIAADPKDAAAHYELGRALAARGEYEPALEHLLATVKLDRTLDNDGARKAMLDIFALLGDADERTQRYRRLLGSVLF